MGKTGTRHRKYDSRNGSGSRRNGSDAATKLMRNGRGAGKHPDKSLEDYPTWLKTLGAIALFGGVLAAAFMTGVIRIDHIDKQQDEVPNSPITDSQPTVAEINESGNRSRKNVTEYTTEEDVIEDTRPDSIEESLHDEVLKDVVTDKEKNTESEQKEPVAIVENKDEDERTETDRSESDQNSEIPAQPNASEQETDERDIPVEAQIPNTKEDEAASNKSDDDDKSKLKQDSTDQEEQDSVPDETVPKADTESSSETERPLDDASEASKTEGTVPEETVPKADTEPSSETERPLEDSSKASETEDERVAKDVRTEDSKVKEKEFSRGKVVRPKKISKEKQAPSDPTEEKSADSDKVESHLEDEGKKIQEKDLRENQKVLEEAEVTEDKSELNTEETPEAKESSIPASSATEDSSRPEEPKQASPPPPPPPPSSESEDIPEVTETKTSTQSEAKTTTQPEAKTTTQPEAKTTTQPKEKTTTQPKAKTTKQAEAKLTTQPEAKTTTQPDEKTTQPDTGKSGSKNDDASGPDETSSPPDVVAKAPETTPPQESSVDGQIKDGSETSVKTETNSPPQEPAPSDKTKEAPRKTKTEPKAEKSKVSPPPPSSSSSSTTSRSTDAPKTSTSRKVDRKVDRDLESGLKEAEALLKKKKTEPALNKYEEVLKKYPENPRAKYGKAQSLDQMAEERRSNDLLQNAIKWYRIAADTPNAPDEIRKGSLSRMGDRLSFLGKSSKSIQIYKELVRAFPQDMEFQKHLAVQYLITGQNSNAKPYFRKMVEINPRDGYALVHLGFILKNEENYEEAIPLLREGIKSGERGTNEGKFFFHLGDSYMRLGQLDEAYKVYDDGVSRGLFRSRYQRSLYNVDSLRAKPFWTPKEASFTRAAKKLENSWESIRDEALSLMSDTGFFKNEDEKLRDTGDWKQFTLYARGSKDEANCQRAPVTCRLVDTIPESSGCKRGQVKFSVMHPGTHVWPHCGPTNCRLRAHLGLVIPQPVRLRVGNTTRTWDEGKLFIFDDSFEHEVWQEADTLRVILIIDLWHPDLSESEKRRLTAI